MRRDLQKAVRPVVVHRYRARRSFVLPIHPYLSHATRSFFVLPGSYLWRLSRRSFSLAANHCNTQQRGAQWITHQPVDGIASVHEPTTGYQSARAIFPTLLLSLRRDESGRIGVVSGLLSSSLRLLCVLGVCSRFLIFDMLQLVVVRPSGFFDSQRHANKAYRISKFCLR